MVLKDPHFKSCERIYTIDSSLSLEIKFLDIKQNPDITNLRYNELPGITNQMSGPLNSA